MDMRFAIRFFNYSMTNLITFLLDHVEVSTVLLLNDRELCAHINKGHKS